jgi:glycosyltransferase involved in cell wall biosynthesis
MAPRFGGAAVSESCLSAHLSEKHQVTVLSRNDRADAAFAKEQGVAKLITFSPFSVLLAFLNPKHPISREVASSDLFHLNGHWFWENYFFARLCYRYQIPYVLHPRGMLWGAYRKPQLKRLFNFLIGNWIASHASKVILLSEFEKRHCEKYPIQSQKLVVIPNGIDAPSEMHLEQQIENYFLYLGRVEPRKNLEFLIEGFATFFKQKKDFKLRIVGPVERGYDESLNQLIRDRNLEGVVTIEPAVYGDKKRLLLQKAKAVVYPAIEEPFGRTVFEAFSEGTLCVVPDKSGGAEYVRQFAPGLIYQEDDVGSLAERLSSICQMPDEKRSEQLKKSQVWVSLNLNWGSITRRVISLYEQVVAFNNAVEGNGRTM